MLVFLLNSALIFLWCVCCVCVCVNLLRNSPYLTDVEGMKCEPIASVMPTVQHNFTTKSSNT